ncbi:MAG: hypothetical protein WB783_17145 [Arenicellales bacterium]
MDSDPESECGRKILDRLAAAGAKGLTTTGLGLPGAGSRKGKACREVLKRLLKSGEIGNLGSAARPRFVAAEHYKPLEIAYDHIEDRAREAGVRLGSKTALSKGLSGAVGKKVDEALKLLVSEGVLLRLKWAGTAVYVHRSALPGTQPTQQPGPAVVAPERPGGAAIRRAYRETVNEFGYPDVLIHEVFLRLGGELEPFKQALLEACREGRAVANVGDWSLSSPEERKAALYINGHPHLRIRFQE